MRWINNNKQRFISFISGLDMRERWALILKSGVVMVALFFIITRPPAIGQLQRMSPTDATPATQAVEDALQDQNLANLRSDNILIHGEIDHLREAQNLQGNSITALDTNWKAAMGFIAFLQAGGMVLSYRRKTV